MFGHTSHVVQHFHGENWKKWQALDPYKRRTEVRCSSHLHDLVCFCLNCCPLISAIFFCVSVFSVSVHGQELWAAILFGNTCLQMVPVVRCAHLTASWVERQGCLDKGMQMDAKEVILSSVVFLHCFFPLCLCGESELSHNIIIVLHDWIECIHSASMHVDALLLNVWFSIFLPCAFRCFSGGTKGDGSLRWRSQPFFAFSRACMQRWRGVTEMASHCHVCPVNCTILLSPGHWAFPNVWNVLQLGWWCGASTSNLQKERSIFRRGNTCGETWLLWSPSVLASWLWRSLEIQWLVNAGEW